MELSSPASGLPKKLPILLKHRYLLEECLGLGGMGVVFKAIDLRATGDPEKTNSEIAIKLLQPRYTSDPQSRQALRTESIIAKRIAHPNFVRGFDIESEGDRLFMTMEYVDGLPLDELLLRIRRSAHLRLKTTKLIQALVSALSYLHAKQIVHADLKPGNILISKNGTPKIMDFGQSQDLKSGKPDFSNDHAATVATEALAYTPAYASRELIKGYKPDVRDDVFALGCITYELFSGSHPYQKVPADQAEALGINPVRIRHLNRYQWAAVRDAIALRRKNRTPTVSAFYRDLAAGM